MFKAEQGDLRTSRLVVTFWTALHVGGMLHGQENLPETSCVSRDFPHALCSSFLAISVRISRTKVPPDRALIRGEMRSNQLSSEQAQFTCLIDRFNTAVDIQFGIDVLSMGF